MSLHLIPGFKQSPSHCGPACIKMILHYYGQEVKEKDIAAIAKTTLKDGTNNKNLLLAARHFGLDGRWQKNGTIKQLETLVKKDIPTIVEWFATDTTHQSDDVHYSIIVGADHEKIILLDPEDGERYTLTQQQFLKVWFSFSGDYIRKTSAVRLRWFLPLTKK